MAPSGHRFGDNDIELVRNLVENGTFAWDDTKETEFHCGFLSPAYFRGRNDLTEQPMLLGHLGRLINDYLHTLPLTHGPQLCYIGIPEAARPLAQAAAGASFRKNEKPPAVFRNMRSMLKTTHGKDNMWVGPPDLKQHSYVTIENVLTSAKSYFEHLRKLEADTYPTKEMHHVAFGDWELGGMEALRADGYQIHTMYKMTDIIAACVYMGLWPQSRQDEMRRRIRQWRVEHWLP